MIRKSVSLAQHGTVSKELEKRLDVILKPGRVHSMHLQWLIDDKISALRCFVWVTQYPYYPLKQITRGAC
ncbi:hypothetical protein C5S36_15905 [Candidatus Methanophagaceae archaeon]|nr:hypothetical protein C5S36_15905 [Methanophagales archaeon]